MYVMKAFQEKMPASLPSPVQSPTQLKSFVLRAIGSSDREKKEEADGVIINRLWKKLDEK